MSAVTNRCSIAGRYARPFLAGLVAMLLLLAMPVGRVMAAGDQPADQLNLLSLQTQPLDPSNPSGGMRIDSKVSYKLASSAKGYLALFTFEDNANNASAQSSPIAIDAGSGQVALNIDYQPDPKVQTVNLLIGLFSSDKRLIGWLATNPLPLDTLAGRLEFQEAMKARQSGDDAGAVDRLTRAIALSPQAGSLYYWRGDTLLRMGQYDEAISDYKAALELMPGNVASLVGLGIAEVWKGQWQDGVSALSAAIDTGSDQGQLVAWAHRARGVAYAALGDKADAVADYQAYLALTPDAPDQSQVQDWITQLGGG